MATFLAVIIPSNAEVAIELQVLPRCVAKYHDCASEVSAVATSPVVLR